MPRQRRRQAVIGEHVTEPDQRRPAIEIEVHQHAGDRIGQIIMPARRVVDQVLPAARRAPLQAGKLGAQAGMVQKLDATRVQKRQQVVIQIALRSRGLLEFNPVLGEPGT